MAVSSRPRMQYTAERYGFGQETVEAALADIQIVEDMQEQVMDLAPACIAWNVVDRRPPKLNIVGDPPGEGFSSLDHAVCTFLCRLTGLRTALTSNTDALLSIGEREQRDQVVTAFLRAVKETYIDITRQ